MNTEIITEAARATLDGSIPFPEVVRRLIETGVEYYHVDHYAGDSDFGQDWDAFLEKDLKQVDVGPWS